eukprot:TRINITY_DN22984_c0_g1_i1.p1 TRINITY_DN22984_c0_g1~~TRINITY_DN22984_c0_g1_i1.p1  ORF type:complete len:858 (+),score=102.05 TRINITY_DN22984_c0_g1_i1:98-2575(+)
MPWDFWREVPPPSQFVSPSRFSWLQDPTLHHSISADEAPRLSCIDSADTTKRQYIQKALNVPFVGVPASAVVDAVGVPIRQLQAHTSKEDLRNSNCSTLPLTALLLVIFFLVGDYHYDAIRIGSAERSIESDIIENANFAYSGHFGHKDLHDVNSYPDFWSWINLGLVPALYQYGYPVSEGSDLPSIEKPFKERPLTTHHHRPIGGMRLTQVTSKPHSCKGDTAILHFIKDIFGTHACVGSAGSMKYEKEQLERMDIQVGKVDSKEWPFATERVEWLYAHWSSEQMKKRLRELEAGQYIDRTTIALVLTLNTYNVELDLYVVTYVSFRFTRGGAILKRVDSLGLPADRYDRGISMYILDGIFVALMLHIAIVEMFAIGKAICRNGWRGFHAYVSDSWNVVDWSSLIIFFFLIWQWIVILVETSHVNATVSQLGDGGPGSDTFVTTVEDIFTAMDHAVRHDNALTVVAAIFPMVIMLRLFKSFSAQPKLSVVTRTLYEASGDLVHFLIIFVTILLSFSTMAHILFGRHSTTFREPIPALLGCVRVMLGDFDWDALVEAGGMLRATIWLFSFTIVMVLQMLNMLLAIVMDTYSAVKAQTISAESLHVTTYKVMMRFTGRLLGLRVAYGTIDACLMKAIDKLPDESDNPILSIDALMEIVPGLGERQARNLMIYALLEDFAMRTRGGSAEGTDLLMQTMESRFKTVLALMKQSMCKKGFNSETLESGRSSQSFMHADSLTLTKALSMGSLPSKSPSTRHSSLLNRVEEVLFKIPEDPERETNLGRLAEVPAELSRIRQNINTMKADVQRLASRLDRICPQYRECMWAC